MVNEKEVKPKGFIVDVKIETESEMEAYYLSAILNSEMINRLIKPLQPGGLFGARTIHRRPLLFPIPEFGGNNQLHAELADISKKCHEKIGAMKLLLDKLKEMKDVYEGAIRKGEYTRLIRSKKLINLLHEYMEINVRSQLSSTEKNYDLFVDFERNPPEIIDDVQVFVNEVSEKFAKLYTFEELGVKAFFDELYKTTMERYYLLGFR